MPELADPPLRIHAHNVGLRPGREGGPRVEVQFVVAPSKGTVVPKLSEASAGTKTKTTVVVHAYGFG